MRRPQFTLKSMLWLMAVVGVLCWAATINSLFAVLVFYVGIGASLAIRRRESRHID